MHISLSLKLFPVCMVPVPCSIVPWEDVLLNFAFSFSRHMRKQTTQHGPCWETFYCCDLDMSVTSNLFQLTISLCFFRWMTHDAFCARILFFYFCFSFFWILKGPTLWVTWWATLWATLVGHLGGPPFVLTRLRAFRLVKRLVKFHRISLWLR